MSTPSEHSNESEWCDLRDAQGRLHARLNLRTGELVIRRRRETHCWRLPLFMVDVFAKNHEHIDQ